MTCRAVTFARLSLADGGTRPAAAGAKYGNDVKRKYHTILSEHVLPRWMMARRRSRADDHGAVKTGSVPGDFAAIDGVGFGRGFLRPVAFELGKPARQAGRSARTSRLAARTVV